jgi:hypothetical protein
MSFLTMSRKWEGEGEIERQGRNGGSSKRQTDRFCWQLSANHYDTTESHSLHANAQRKSSYLKILEVQGWKDIWIESFFLIQSKKIWNSHKPTYNQYQSMIKH